MHSLGQNYREVTAALYSVMDCISQQQQHHLVSLLSPTTGLSRQPIVMAPTTPVIVISTDRHPSTPEGYKSIGTMPKSPAGMKSIGTDPMTPIGIKSTSTTPSTLPATKSVSTSVETPIKITIGIMSHIPTKVSKSTMPKTPQKD